MTQLHVQTPEESATAHTGWFPGRSFEDLLVSSSLLNELNLLIAKEHAEREALPLVDAVVALGLVAKGDSYALLSRATGLPLVELAGLEVSQLALRLVPSGWPAGTCCCRCVKTIGPSTAGRAIRLRSVLRQDPNVIMVGEIRDSEVAQIVGQAAYTVIWSSARCTPRTRSLPRPAVIGRVDEGRDPVRVHSRGPSRAQRR